MDLITVFQIAKDLAPLYAQYHGKKLTVADQLAIAKQTVSVLVAHKVTLEQLQALLDEFSALEPVIGPILAAGAAA
jgi:hypothetical protein